MALIVGFAQSSPRPLSGGQADLPWAAQSVAIDPKATLAVHCGKGFDAGLSPIKVLV
jgi:hypothetical protein